MPKVFDTIRANLKDAMEYQGVSQNELCRRTGISVGNFNQFLQGKRGISIQNLDRIAAELGLEMSEFFVESVAV